jgi:hypothetical protein
MRRLRPGRQLSPAVKIRELAATCGHLAISNPRQDPAANEAMNLLGGYRGVVDYEAISHQFLLMSLMRKRA